MQSFVINEQNYIYFLIAFLVFDYFSFRNGYECGLLEQYSFDVLGRRSNRRTKFISKFKSLISKIK